MGEYYFRSRKIPQIFAALAASVGALAFGSTLGWASPALPSISELPPFALSGNSKAWITSIVMLGACLSCPLAGFLAEYVGRKRTIVLMGIPFFIAWILVAYAGDEATLQIARFITGFCGGTYSVTIPMYISEISEKHIRGALGTCFQLMLASGILFSYVVGSYVNWFWLSLTCSILPFLLIILMIFMPESPYYLLKQGRVSEASRTLCWLRSAGLSINVDPELRQIQNGILETRNSTTRFRSIFQKRTLKPLGLCFALMFFQQLSGINAVIFYAHTIFTDAGPHLNAKYAAIALAVTLVIATALASGLIDRTGRRILFLVSEILVTLSLVITGLYFYLISYGMEYGEDIGWLPLTGLCTFMAAFSIGLGPLPWIYMGEILPANGKGFTSAITAMVPWILAFFITHFFQTYQILVDDAYAFWTFAVVSGAGIIFTFVGIPETSGKTPDEIQRAFGA